LRKRVKSASDEDKKSLEQAIGLSFVAAVEEIQKYRQSVLITGKNVESYRLYCLLSSLSVLPPRDFIQIVHNQKQRLRRTWDDQKIEDMGDEFRVFKNSLHNDEQFSGLYLVEMPRKDLLNLGQICCTDSLFFIHSVAEWPRFFQEHQLWSQTLVCLATNSTIIAGQSRSFRLKEYFRPSSTKIAIFT
jgi:hypothetical protein